MFSVYSIPKFDAMLVHCLWNDGNEAKCSQVFSTFEKVIANGINIYPMISMRLLIKNKMNRCIKENKFSVDMKPSLFSCLSFTRKPIDFEFCKNQKKMHSFVTNIIDERKKILSNLTGNDSYDMTQFQKWDGGKPDELINYGQVLANSFNNFDLNDRHDNDHVLCLYTPPPRQITIRRYNKGQTAAEKSFITFCETVTKDEAHITDRSNPTNCRASTKEVQMEWNNIKKEKCKQFFPRPVDLCINDWLAQMQNKPIKIRLSGLSKQIENLQFDDFEGDLKEKTADKENEIKQKIVNGLKKLERIQEEKECLTNKKISLDLVNENCFPEMAEILKDAGNTNKQFNIFLLSDSEDDYESWTDSWSSD